ncbi:MAG: hypothetical protein WD069_04605 [Planctomycetales bacterium]
MRNRAVAVFGLWMAVVSVGRGGEIGGAGAAALSGPGAKPDSVPDQLAVQDERERLFVFSAPWCPPALPFRRDLDAEKFGAVLKRSPDGAQVETAKYRVTIFDVDTDEGRKHFHRAAAAAGLEPNGIPMFYLPDWKLAKSGYGETSAQNLAEWISRTRELPRIR